MQVQQAEPALPGGPHSSLDVLERKFWDQTCVAPVLGHPTFNLHIIRVNRNVEIVLHESTGFNEHNF